MTLFERHREQHGETSRHAHPDGFHIIEECEECQLAWVLPCKIDSPGTVPHTLWHHWKHLNNRNAAHSMRHGCKS